MNVAELTDRDLADWVIAAQPAGVLAQMAAALEDSAAGDCAAETRLIPDAVTAELSKLAEALGLTRPEALELLSRERIADVSSMVPVRSWNRWRSER